MSLYKTRELIEQRCDIEWVYPEKDVKEFIKKYLQEEIILVVALDCGEISSKEYWRRLNDLRRNTFGKELTE